MNPQENESVEELRKEVQEMNTKLEVLIRNLPVLYRATSDLDFQKSEEMKRRMRNKSGRKFVGLDHWLMRIVSEFDQPQSGKIH